MSESFIFTLTFNINEGFLHFFAETERDIWDRVFLRRGKWAKFGDMLILDSPLVYWMGLINVAPCHSELAEPGQAQSSTLPSLLHRL